MSDIISVLKVDYKMDQKMKKNINKINYWTKTLRDRMDKMHVSYYQMWREPLLKSAIT